MKIEVFPGKRKGEWFWHFKNKGRVIANNEAFPTKAHAMRAAKGVVNAVCKQVGARPTFTATETDGVTTIKLH